MAVETQTRRWTREEIDLETRLLSVSNLVHTENCQQIVKWGKQDHTPAFWALILLEEVGELAHALLSEYRDIPQEQRGVLMSAANVGAVAQLVLEGKLPDRMNLGFCLTDSHDSATEAVQVAAVCIAMIENMQRGGDDGLGS